MKEEILMMLKENSHEFISGQDISKRLGVSRTAIWKYINQIKEDGYNIESAPKKGYKIISSPDILTLEELNPYLHTQFMGRNVFHFDTIDSTNTKAKQMADLEVPDGSIVISEEQTNGRGRLGRSWVSPKHKGIWMSILLRPELSPMDAVKLTQTAAAAVVIACQELGIETKVKWPNDVVINSKKICGILTEMSAELTRINYVVVGIGINANLDQKDFPDDIKQIATSLKAETGLSVNRKELTSKILNNFEELYLKLLDCNDFEASLNICRNNSAVIGKEILVVNRGLSAPAKALDMDAEGRLLVEYANGSREYLVSGEVSIRGTESYI